MAIRNKRYIVRLNQEEREALTRLVRSGKAAAHKVTRARILLKTDIGESRRGWPDQRIADALDVSPNNSPPSTQRSQRPDRKEVMEVPVSRTIDTAFEQDELKFTRNVLPYNTLRSLRSLRCE